MPLIDPTLITKVEVGEDWYILRNLLGFFDETIQLVDAIDPTELSSFRRLTDKEGRITSSRTPGQIIAQQNLTKLSAYLTDWSHPEKLTPENIKRIPPDAAKMLMKKITELEDSAPKPFREESKTGGSNSVLPEGLDKEQNSV